MDEPFATWVEEMTAALAAARAELTVAEVDHEQALIACRDATAQRVAIARAFALLGRQQPVGALQVRRHGYERGLAEAAVTLQRATNNIAAHRKQIQEYELALAQLDQISPPDADDASEAA